MKRVIWLAALLLLGSCARGTPPPMEEDTFVAVVVELRRAATKVAVEEEFGPVREEILARHGVTEEQLEAYVRWAGRRPERLRATFERIHVALREPEQE